MLLMLLLFCALPKGASAVRAKDGDLRVGLLAVGTRFFLLGGSVLLIPGTVGAVEVCTAALTVGSVAFSVMGCAAFGANDNVLVVIGKYLSANGAFQPGVMYHSEILSIECDVVVFVDLVLFYLTFTQTARKLQRIYETFRNRSILASLSLQAAKTPL
jgi:hypothetical protein